MIYLYYFFAAVLVWLSYKSFTGGVRYLRYFKDELAKPDTGYRPFATIFAPCRGVDEDLRENLAALFDQNYPQYEIVFVVDDPLDPAVEIINGLLAESPDAGPRAKLVIAPKATGSSQKVENLREAVLHAALSSAVFVFVDSDVRPQREWLANLAAAVADTNIGAATGYRWFFSKTNSLASELRSAWNGSVATTLGPNMRLNFCWAGAMALRREVFEKFEIRDRWKGTFSDDFTVTRVLNAAGMPIKFVPQAITPSIEDCTFGELMEFTTRQMKITRVYATPLWLMSLAGYSVFLGTLAASLLILLLNPAPLHKAIAAAVIIFVAALSAAKAVYRVAAIKLVLPGHEAELQRQAVLHSILWAVTPTIFLYNSLSALVSRRVIWRGTAYILKSPFETVIIQDK